LCASTAIAPATTYPSVTEDPLKAIANLIRAIALFLKSRKKDK
jgi:hypothetical protein